MVHFLGSVPIDYH